MGLFEDEGFRGKYTKVAYMHLQHSLASVESKRVFLKARKICTKTHWPQS